MDKIGSFYYTKEEYDNKNPTFGSTYPDYNGAVGILFEQASSRGIQQDSENGLLTFAHTLRNQLVASLATVDAANGHKDKLFDLQKEFFTANVKNPKAYVIGDRYDASRLNKFINLLLSHRLEVYENNQDVTLNGVTYEKGKSFIAPVGQPNAALVQIIFDDKKDYDDASKLGYGAGFSVAYSSGLSFDQVTNPAKGAKVEALRKNTVVPFQQSDYAYLVDFRDSKSQQFLLRLLEKDLIVKTASRPFTVKTAVGEAAFTYGALLIPVSNQKVSSNDLFNLLKKVSEKERINVVPVATGYSVKGVDLGSSAFKRVKKPSVLLVTGGGVSSNEAGEVWHLFDQKLSYPIVRVEQSSLGRISLKDFSQIIFPGGSYTALETRDQEALKDWINGGGTLIAFNSASQWILTNKILNGVRNTEDKKAPDAASGFLRGRQPTSIFESRINLESPIAFGLTNEALPVIRESLSFLPGDSINSVSRYSAKPLLNGYLQPDAAKYFKDAASIKTVNSGSGTIVLFAEDPLFRGIWDATERTFINAVLFGDKLRGGFRY
ncbi:hypothetical protein Barb6_02096 [Bacteroidales bacterium Barb6]|nr:hypothetical protein Barb6_02096 [Bacteroidales bacterium Barb6]